MINTCLRYHCETSYERNRMGGHVLDWANQPTVYKTYQGLAPLTLSRQVALSKHKLSELLLDTIVGIPAPQIELAALSAVMLLSYTLTAKAHARNEDFYYRSTASAGALYPTEVYLAIHGVDGLQDGLYHYDIHTHGLVPLRNGKFGPGLLESAGSIEQTLPVVTFFLTAVLFRSAWKYRARAYRYHLMDTGHVEENLTLALKALGLGYRVSYDFDDDRVNHLLGLDPDREVALGLVSLSGGPSTRAIAKSPIDPLPLSFIGASRVAPSEVDYPIIREMHAAGKKRVLPKGPSAGMLDALGVRLDDWRQTQPASVWNESTDYPECVFRRRSKRNFVKQPLSYKQMAGLVACVNASGRENYQQALAAGFLSGPVEGMDPGFYLLNREKKATCQVVQGAYLETMAHICLDQTWLVNAGVHFLFLADLDLLDQTWGARGYRYALMSAGRLGQRLYLAATAMGLGCCGIGAFYDEEARALLGLSQNARLLYLVAVGTTKNSE